MGTDIKLTAELASYLGDIQPREPELFRQLRKETENLGSVSAMQIGWVQARLMQALIKTTGAKSYLEVGTFTGYSALSAALALPGTGRVYALDLNEEWTSIGKKYWKKAGVDHKIELMIGDAGESLQRLLASDLAGRLDIMFIDADKTSYAAYFDAAMTLLRPGGLAIIDNVLWSGDVIDPANREEDTEAIRHFNAQMAVEDRAFISTIPVGDGLTLAVRQ